jgi:hypothetical protein
MLGPCGPGDRGGATGGVQPRLGAVFLAPTQGEQARDEQQENEGSGKNQIMHGTISLHRGSFEGCLTTGSSPGFLRPYIALLSPGRPPLVLVPIWNGRGAPNRAPDRTHD